MIKEIYIGAELLIKFLTLKQNEHGLNQTQLDALEKAIIDLMIEKYSKMWYEDRPEKASASRCIMIDDYRMDDIVAEATVKASLGPRCFLRQYFPPDITVWIDPRCVAYRLGEDGDIENWYVEGMAPSVPGASTSVMDPGNAAILNAMLRLSTHPAEYGYQIGGPNTGYVDVNENGNMPMPEIVNGYIYVDQLQGNESTPWIQYNQYGYMLHVYQPGIQYCNYYGYPLKDNPSGIQYINQYGYIYYPYGNPSASNYYQRDR